MIKEFTITVKCPATNKYIYFDISQGKYGDWHLQDRRIVSGMFTSWNTFAIAVEQVLSITPNHQITYHTIPKEEW